MKIYIAGKITGLPLSEVKEKFKHHSELLQLKGYTAVNPIEVSPFHASKTWYDYMKDCIVALMDCEAIYLLEDWGQSKGARLEYAIAKELGLDIFIHGDFN